MGEPVIRDATAADLPRLVELLAQLSLDEQREAEGRIEATAVLIIIPNLSHQGTPWAMVENVVVDERRRRSGHGRLLMQAAAEAARAAGCSKLALTSNKRRADAHRFYQSLGFRASHEGFRIDIDSG